MSDIPPEMQALRDRSLKDLKAILAARAKVGIPIHLLCHEYEETTFEKLKFREMGYGTILQLVTDHPTYFNTSPDINGHIIVKAIPSKEDAHIHRLVSGQKKKSKGKKSKKLIPLIPVRRKATQYNSMTMTFKRNAPQCFTSVTKNRQPFPPSRQYNRSYHHTINTTATTAFRNRPNSNIINLPNNVPPRFRRNLTKHHFSGVPISSPKSPNPENQRTTFVFQNENTRNKNNISSGRDDRMLPPKNSSTPTILATSSDLATLEKNLKTLLQNRPHGLYATRLKPEYRNLFNAELPTDIKAIILREFVHFIKIESPVPAHEILYLKEDDSQNSNQKQTTTQTVSQQETVSPQRPLNNSVKRRSGTPRCEFKIDNLPLPKVDENIEVYVCHIESLDRFFVQLEDSLIQDLVDAMQEFYDHVSKSDSDEYQINKPRVGEFCCARYTEDKSWFRAKILSVKEQKNVLNESYRCHVLYPDYGNDEYVLSNELQCLTEKFCVMPFQAFQCCLNNLYSPDEKSDWSDDAIEYFRKVTNNVRLDLRVIEVNGNILSVDMLDGNRQSVCDHLCTTGHARSKSDRHASQPTMSPIANPRDGNPKMLWRTLSLDANEEEAQVSWVQIPTEIDYIDVCVSYITSSCDIHVIMVGPEHHIKLEALESALNNNFENATSQPARQVEVGRYYVAYWDECWYRAQLLSVGDEDCEIWLVDHGNKTIVSREELKDIPSKFLKLPFQAMSCRLKDVPLSSDPEILQYITDLVLGKVYIGSVFSREKSDGMTTVSIELVDTTQDDDIVINSLLIERIEAEKDLEPRLPEVGEGSCGGFIAYVNSAGDFFLQIGGPGLDRLELLTNDITSHFSKANRAAEIISRPEIGTICCAKCPETKMWYRAQVKQIFQEERKVEVEFVDYGNREVVIMVLIRKPTAVSDKVTTLPFQAVKCKLDGLDKLTLDESTYVKLKEFSEMLEAVYISVLDKSDDGTPIVQLCIPPMIENDKNHDFLERFQEYLDYGDTIFDVAEEEESGILANVCSSTANDTMCTTYENISLTQTNNNGAVPRDQRCASNNTTLSEWDVISSGNTPIKSSTSFGSGGTAAATSTIHHHEQLSDIREEEQKSSSGVSSATSSTLSMNANRSVTPVFFDSQQLGIPQLKITSRFIVAFVNDATGPFQFSIIREDMWEQLQTLHKQMLQFYKDYTSETLRDVTSLNVGDACVVYHTEHELWYRAVIHAIIEDKMVVKYPDFNGELEMVPSTNIRLIDEKFKSFPFFAIRCSLHGIEPIPGPTWTEEACQKFQDMVINETFQVEIVGDVNAIDKTKPLEVLLHTSVNGAHVVVNANLVQLGFARQKQAS